MAITDWLPQPPWEGPPLPRKLTEPDYQWQFSRDEYIALTKMYNLAQVKKSLLAGEGVFPKSNYETRLTREQLRKLTMLGVLNK